MYETVAHAVLADAHDDLVIRAEGDDQVVLQLTGSWHVINFHRRGGATYVVLRRDHDTYAPTEEGTDPE